MQCFPVYLISYGCSVSVAGPAAFRIAWGIQGIPGFVLGGAMFFFPESPRWLADRTTDPFIHLYKVPLEQFSNTRQMIAGTNVSMSSPISMQMETGRHQSCLRNSMKSRKLRASPLSRKISATLAYLVPKCGTGQCAE